MSSQNCYKITARVVRTGKRVQVKFLEAVTCQEIQFSKQFEYSLG